MFSIVELTGWTIAQVYDHPLSVIESLLKAGRRVNRRRQQEAQRTASRPIGWTEEE